MSNKLSRYLSYEAFINKLVSIPYSSYHIIILSLILLGTICNCNSNQPLPGFWLLVFGFVFIIYIDIYSLKQNYIFCDKIATDFSGDAVLLAARLKLVKYMHSNVNWLIVLIIPALIVPAVIYIMKYPLGLPIKIFAFTALYFIILLCLVSYIQYVYLIRLSFFLMHNAGQIEKYDRSRPHKTDWLVKLAAVTNKESNMFFIVGASFVFLLYQITLTGLYGIQEQDYISNILVVYLWSIEAVAIVVMFSVFSACSYFFIKKMINKLVAKSIKKCSIEHKAIMRQKKRKKWQVLLQLNELKILMLEKTPAYPEKPLVSYAISYIIAFLNLVATVEAVRSLILQLT